MNDIETPNPVPEGNKKSKKRRARKVSGDLTAKEIRILEKRKIKSKKLYVEQVANLTRWAQAVNLRPNLKDYEIRFLNVAVKEFNMFSGMFAELCENIGNDEELNPVERQRRLLAIYAKGTMAAFHLGAYSIVPDGVVEKIESAVEDARKELPKKGRQVLRTIQSGKRERVIAAIRTIQSFAKSNAFAKRAAIVVLEKTGYDIPWQTIKSSYLLKMDRQEIKGAA